MKSYYMIVLFILLVLKLPFTASIAQTNWTKYENNPVLSPVTPSNWEDWGVYAPFVLKQGDTLKMWYTGVKSFGVQQIGYAVSIDGINWQRYQNNPVLRVGSPGSWDAVYVGYPRIIFDGSTYHMWYFGNKSNSNPIYRIGYATSPDGIHWTKADSVNPVLPLGEPGTWDDATHAGHSYFFDADTFHLWFVGGDEPPTTPTRRYRIGYAKSGDGITWEKHPEPVFYGAGSWDSLKIHNPCVIVDSSGYHMWYQGKYGLNYRIGYATSPDGIHNWVALDTFVLDIGNQGSWEEKGVGTPHILVDDTTCHMWFNGWVNNPNIGYHIGYATAPAECVSAISVLSKNFPSNFVLHQNYPNPFNPSTTIEFTLPESDFVELKVYNILGREVSTLVSNKLNQGKHTYTFDGKNMASGVYHYQLVAGDYKEVKKMILLK